MTPAGPNAAEDDAGGPGPLEREPTLDRDREELSGLDLVADLLADRRAASVAEDDVPPPVSGSRQRPPVRPAGTDVLSMDSGDGRT